MPVKPQDEFVIHFVFINQVLQFISSNDDDAKQLINIIKEYVSLE